MPRNGGAPYESQRHAATQRGGRGRDDEQQQTTTNVAAGSELVDTCARVQWSAPEFAAAVKAFDDAAIGAAPAKAAASSDDGSGGGYLSG